MLLFFLQKDQCCCPVYIVLICNVDPAGWCDATSAHLAFFSKIGVCIVLIPNVDLAGWRLNECTFCVFQQDELVPPRCGGCTTVGNCKCIGEKGSRVSMCLLWLCLTVVWLSSFSRSVVVLCLAPYAWLGSKHQLTTVLGRLMSTTPPPSAFFFPFLLLLLLLLFSFIVKVPHACTRAKKIPYARSRFCSPR